MARASALFGALAVALAAQRQLDAGAAGSGATLAVLALAIFGLASRAVALPARDAPAVAAARPSAWSIVGADVLLAALGCALILLFLAVMQLPSLLVLAFPDEVPGAVRASGALVPACLLAALPVPLAWRALRAAALLAWEGRETWQGYFVTYAAEWLPGVRAAADHAGHAGAHWAD